MKTVEMSIPRLLIEQAYAQARARNYSLNEALADVLVDAIYTIDSILFTEMTPDQSAVRTEEFKKRLVPHIELLSRVVKVEYIQHHPV